MIQNAKLLAQLRALQEDYDDLQRDRDHEVAELRDQINDLQAQMEEVLKQMQILSDAKLSLELEIACYRKLLEGEEKR